MKYKNLIEFTFSRQHEYMHTTPTGSEEEAEEKEQKEEEQKRLAEEDIIMKSRLLSNAFKCLSP